MIKIGSEIEKVIHPESATDDDFSGRFDFLMEQSKKFCKSVGLQEDLMYQISDTESDWAFILKIDALLEAAIKEIIKSGLKLKILNRFVGTESLSEFVEALPVNGKASLMHLLRASGCPSEDANFVEAIRRIRNAYAHNISLSDLSLIELIKQRPDKSHIIKNVSNISSYDEQDLIKSYEYDGGFLRFGIFDATMRILFYAYHIAMKPAKQAGKK